MEEKMNCAVQPSNGERRRIHVFMVSFPGQGHVNPLLRLGKRLARFGLFVTLAAPEFAGVNIRKTSNIPADGSPVPFGRGMIRLEFFHDGWDFDDPKRLELEPYMTQLELAGREKLPEMIQRQAEEGRPVSCLINNPFIPWVSDVGESLGIPSAMLWVQSCVCFSAYYHFYHKLVPFPSKLEPEIDVQLPSLPLLKHDEVPSFLHPTDPYQFLAKAILDQFKNLSKPFCILMETFEELEREVIDSASRICGRPIRTIGPLFKPLRDNSGRCEENGPGIRADFFAADDCTDFLDSKPPRSVVYISFGSVVHLKQEQVDELAYGLLAADVAFLWVMRPPPPMDSTAEPQVLPEGFLEKVGDKGRIVKWAPQEKVLAHPSTACFVTHCGWNSSVEALASGVPVAAFPQWGDQVTNAKFLVEVLRVGVRMCRGLAEGRVTQRDQIERCLRAVVGGGAETEEMMANAARWREAAEAAVRETGSSYRNIMEFMDEVVHLSGLRFVRPSQIVRPWCSFDCRSIPWCSSN